MQLLLVGLQMWQASQLPLHWPVWGLQVWQRSAEQSGTQRPSSQRWQGGQPPEHCPLCGSQVWQLGHCFGRHMPVPGLQLWQVGQGFGAQVPVAGSQVVHDAQQTTWPLGLLQSLLGSWSQCTHWDWHCPRCPGASWPQKRLQAGLGSSSARASRSSCS
jgi:hypothetical protein